MGTHAGGAGVMERRWGFDSADGFDQWGFDSSEGFQAWVFGTERAPGRETPERLIVQAARAIGIQAYAVFQPGGIPGLPSIIFQSTGVSETEVFERGNLEVQEFSIEVRARGYQEVVDTCDAFYDALRAAAGSRYGGIRGEWSDAYMPALEYRSRSFSIALRR